MSHPTRRDALTVFGATASAAIAATLARDTGLVAAFGQDAATAPRAPTFPRGAVIRTLLKDPGIVRNRLKIHSTVTNASAFLAVRDEFGSFDRYIWQFVGGSPIVHRYRSPRQVPAHSAESDLMSTDLRRRGFSFVGSTICYAFMQAVGMVNDHATNCFRARELRNQR